MKKVLKKMACLMMSLTMVAVLFAGCASNEGEPAASAPEGEKTYTVGICQLVQHDALDAATKGFKTALTDKLGDKVTFDEQNASGEVTNCTTICSKFVSDKVDLIMANATDALTAASSATADIPIVATSITDYATALKISDWKGTTGINVTGTSDLAPLAEQADMIKELYPDAKTVGILYCSAEANSKYQADVITESLTKMGYEVKVFTFVDTNDVTQVTQAVAEECDVMYVPTDNTAASNTEAINNVLEPAKIPVIAGEEGICKGCGLATLSISYYDIGYKAGEMAAQILTENADPATMPIEFAKDLTKKYVPARADLLGVKIPEGYTAIQG